MQPDNFLFVSNDEDSLLKAIDFGLSIRHWPSEPKLTSRSGAGDEGEIVSVVAGECTWPHSTSTPPRMHFGSMLQCCSLSTCPPLPVGAAGGAFCC